jgi:hypothetical protein
MLALPALWFGSLTMLLAVMTLRRIGEPARSDIGEPTTLTRSDSNFEAASG